MAKKTRILLVEDETDVLRANRDYLQKQGYEVRCAETLHDARVSLWEYPPDIILLDVMLPDGSGYEFCEELRETSTVPVVFLTAKGSDGNIVGGLSLGGDDYIVKPYSMEVMGARVAALLRRRGIGSAIIELPPLSIDVAAGIVRLSGEEVSLSRKELQLLLYFVENQGRELSPGQIYESIWGGPAETMSSTVRANISRLRQKLRLDGTDAFELSSTANQGYIFLRLRFPAAE